MPNYEWIATSAPKQTRHDDIWFVAPNKGWTVNSNGQILHTTDYGATWSEQAQVGVGTWLRCVAFADELTGWVGSTSKASRLWSTKNGGKSWSRALNLPGEPSAICGLWVADPDTIYAAGTNYPDRPTAILKSEDGGVSWQSSSMDKYASLLVDIFFVDRRRGWVVGGKGGESRKDVKPIVLYTEDGGATWVDQLAGMENRFPAGEWGWKIQFLDDQVGFVSLENFADAAILRTENGGKDWVRLPVKDPQQNANLEGIGFLNSATGWVGGWGDRQFKGGYSSSTADGGKTWMDANQIGRFLNRFRFTGDSDVVAYASGDTIYRYSKVGASIELHGIIPIQQTAMRPPLISDHLHEFRGSLSIPVNVPPGAKRLTVEIWDRFAGYVSEIRDEINPVPGLSRIEWNGTDSKGADVGDGHFIYRVTIDGDADSRIVRRIP